MTTNGLNLLGVLAAFAFCFISGAVWFGPKTFYPVWMRAKGVASGQLKPGGRPDVQSLLAGLNQRGEAALQATVARRQPI